MPRVLLPGATIWLLLLRASPAARSRRIISDIANAANLSSAVEWDVAEHAALVPGKDAASLEVLLVQHDSSVPEPIALGDVLASAGAPVLISKEHAAVVVGQAAGDDVGFVEAFLQALAVMCAAEIFDRSWFVVLICSLRHGMLVTLLSSFSALALHSVLAVSIGKGIAYLLPKWSLEVFSAAVLGGFAVYYTLLFFSAEPSEEGVIVSNSAMTISRDNQPGRKESAVTISNGAKKPPPVDSSGVAMSESERIIAGGTAFSAELAKKRAVWWTSFAIVFVTLFIAEWGDRTQIVQISMAASLPALPVFLGSVTGLCILCVTAVALAGLMEGRDVDEKILNLICGVCFGIMALLAVYHAGNEFIEGSSAAA